MKKRIRTITLGGIRYPKFNNIVIKMGGVESHSFFVVRDMLLLDGITFNRWKLRSKAFRTNITKNKLKDIWGVDLDTLDLKNPKDMRTIDDSIFEWSDVKNRIKNAMVRGVRNVDPRRKPNIIIDEMITDDVSFKNYCVSLAMIGYDKKDIHLIWNVGDVVLDMEDSIDRGGDKIDTNLVFSAHERIAKFMSDVFTSKLEVTKYMDGDIWLVFDKDDAVQVKKSGSPIDMNQLDYQVVDKLLDRTPQIHPIKFR